MAYRSKLGVLNALYDLLERQLPLSEALVASLGGEGVEARLLTERGIAPERGWLIDRSPHQMRGLRRHHPNFRRYQGSLSGFVEKGFLPQHGSDVGLDAFHWDLCGTTGPVTDDLNPLLPLILKSRGKMLFVTVADARRSSPLQEPAVVRAQAKVAFGKHWDGLWRSLVAMHERIVVECASRADPEDAALREVANLLVVLRSLLVTATFGQGDEVGLHFFPAQLCRFIYLSGIRMRTYAFRFAEVDTGSPLYTQEMVVEAFVRLAMSPPLIWVKGSTMTPVTFPDQPQLAPPAPTPVRVDGSQEGTPVMARTARSNSPNLSPELTDAISRLEGHMAQRLLAPVAIPDLKRLIMYVRKGGMATVDEAALREEITTQVTRDLLTKLLDSVGEGLQGLRDKFGKLVTGPSKTKVGKKRTRKKGARPNRDLSPADADQIRLRLLRARFESREDAERQVICTELGMELADAGPTLGAIMAYANPKRCRLMVQRLVQAAALTDREALIDELARILPLKATTVRKYGRKNAPKKV